MPSQKTLEITLFAVPLLIIAAMTWFLTETNVGKSISGLIIIGFIGLCIWQGILWFFNDLKPEVRWWLLVAAIAVTIFVWLFL